MFSNSKMIQEGRKYRYILAFGSNLGKKKFNCEEGLKLLKEEKIVKISQYLETKPLASEKYSNVGHENYCNMVCEILSHHKPLELYQIIVSIEDAIGHNRSGKWLPRKLDIDILFWAENTKDNFNNCSPLFFCKDDFQVPHRGFSERPFLQELCSQDLKISDKCLASHLKSRRHSDPE